MKPVTVATWNLENVRPRGGIRTARIRDAMAALTPDVWVLTESHPEFQPGPGYSLRALSCGSAPDRWKGGCWVAIWVRGSVGADALSMAGEPERSAGVRIDQGGGRPLAVFGTVLPWRGDVRHDAYRGGAAFRRSIELQARDWAEAGAGGADVCIAGDFNQEVAASGPAGTLAGRQGLDEVLQRLELTCMTGGAHDPLYSRGWRRGIDHILLSRGLSVTGERPQIWPDVFPLPAGWPDHHGVAVTFATSSDIHE